MIDLICEFLPCAALPIRTPGCRGWPTASFPAGLPFRKHWDNRKRLWVTNPGGARLAGDFSNLPPSASPDPGRSEEPRRAIVHRCEIRVPARPVPERRLQSIASDSPGLDPSPDGGWQHSEQTQLEFAFAFRARFRTSPAAVWFFEIQGLASKHSNPHLRSSPAPAGNRSDFRTY